MITAYVIYDHGVFEGGFFSSEELALKYIDEEVFACEDSEEALPTVSSLAQDGILVIPIQLDESFTHLLDQ